MHRVLQLPSALYEMNRSHLRAKLRVIGHVKMSKFTLRLCVAEFK